jgi:hypothetical protein
MREAEWFVKTYFDKPLLWDDESGIPQLDFILVNADGKMELDTKEIVKMIEMGANVHSWEDAVKMATWQVDCPLISPRHQMFIEMQRRFLLRTDEEIEISKRIADQVTDAIPMIKIMKEHGSVMMGPDPDAVFLKLMHVENQHGQEKEKGGEGDAGVQEGETPLGLEEGAEGEEPETSRGDCAE